MSLNFMKMISDINSRRYLRQMQNLIMSKTPCGFFCGFEIPSNVKEIIQSVKNFGINISCIIIADEESKKLFADDDIFVTTLRELPNSPVKVSQVFYILGQSWLENAFYKYFERYGIAAFQIHDINAMESQFNFHLNFLPELYSAYEMFSDEESKAVYRAYITGKLTGCLSDYKFAPESQYFLEGFLPVKGDIAIDGGAYDGATSRDFAMQGAKVYAFEMSEQNYKNCLKQSRRRRKLQRRRCRSLQGRGTETANFIDLDTYVLRKNLPRVDYIKLDIEGAELDMLHGAAKTISR